MKKIIDFLNYQIRFSEEIHISVKAILVALLAIPKKYLETTFARPNQHQLKVLLKLQILLLHLHLHCALQVKK